MPTSEWTPLPPRLRHVQIRHRPAMELRRPLGFATASLAVVLAFAVVVPPVVAKTTPPEFTASVDWSEVTAVRPTLPKLVLSPRTTTTLGLNDIRIGLTGDELVMLAPRVAMVGPVGTVPSAVAVPIVVEAVVPDETIIRATEELPVATSEPGLVNDTVSIDPVGDGPDVDLDRILSSVPDGPVAARETGPSESIPDMPGDSPESETGPMVEARSVLELPSLLQASRASEHALVVEPLPADAFECYERASSTPLVDKFGQFDSNLIAQMTSEMFRCVSSVGGFAELPASWNGDWYFETLADQVAAEAVVVAYCESIGFRPSALAGDNPWGYGGLFQMGATEIRRFGFAGASKFEPVDNAYAAATYFMFMNSIGGGWGGWGPWAVVNTSFSDEVNDQVKVPVLPRFRSTDPDYSGRSGAELPAWAVDPWSYRVPSFDGCPVTGGSWAPAVALME